MINKLSICIAFLALPLLLLLGSCNNVSEQAKETEEKESLRIISLSGFITELLFELGYGDQIIARDVTSTYPEAANAIESLGHISRLNVEAIIALQPEIIFLEKASEESVKFIDQLTGAGIKVVSVPTSTTFDNSLKAIQVLKDYLHIDQAIAEKIRKQLDADSLALAEYLTGKEDAPKVLFLYARGAGNVMAGGYDTPSSRMIEKAGGINVMNSFDNYRAITPEALIGAAPEVLLFFSSGLASLDEGKGLSEIPGMSQTPAFKENKIVAMDGQYLTTFGPRSAKAAVELAKKLREE